MPAKKVTVKHSLHSEFRAMTNGIAAFSTATLLLFLQGNFGELDEHSVIALLFFTATIPICISASFISFLFTQRTHIPAWADSALDWFMIAGWVGGIVGLGALLVSADSLLAIVFGVSIGIAFVVFVCIAYGIGESDGRSCTEALSANDAEQPEANAIENKES